MFPLIALALNSTALAASRDLSAEAEVVPEAPEPITVRAPEDRPDQLVFHGFRVGYTYVNIDEDSVLESPHLFVLGYEATYRALGGDWLDVVLIGNGSVAGINQSVFVPSANGLVGFAIKKQIEVGTGINWSPFDPSYRYVHQVLAVGWTPPAGKFNVPIHVTWIPDVDGHWRLGSTIGVNW
jgi:hypothetical protein